MRHQKHRFILGRTKEHRIALMANMASALFRHGRIETTLSKAKALRPFAERVISLAKRSHNQPKDKILHLRRQAIARLRDPQAVEILFDQRVGEFLNRPGGYTRIYKLGQRKGDAAEMALICLIEASDEGYDKRRKNVKSAKLAENTPAADSPDSEKTGDENNADTNENLEPLAEQVKTDTVDGESSPAVLAEDTSESVSEDTQNPQTSPQASEKA